MAEQLIEAAILLGVGMSVVFFFLTLLIGGIKGIQWYCTAFPSAEQETQAHHNNDNSAPSPSPTTVSPQLHAAIQTAVNLHRQQN